MVIYQAMQTIIHLLKIFQSGLQQYAVESVSVESSLNSGD